MPASKAFVLNGCEEQKMVLVSAVRYAWGRSTYLPSSLCAILRDHMGEIDQETAYVIARDIREEWCRDYDGRFGTPSVRGQFYSCDVKPFVDLLPLLDEVAKPAVDKYPAGFLPQPPVGYATWDEVPEEVRYRWPTQGRLEI